LQQFIEKYRDEIEGTLSGLDRMIFRATPRRLNIFQRDHSRGILVAKGMEEYFWQNKLRFKDFGRHVQSVSGRVKDAFLKPFQEQRRPLEYIRSCKTDKEKRAHEIAARDRIESGLICAFSTMEMSPTFEYQKSRLVYRLRPCPVLYSYQKHPQLGFLHARIQSWFPFHLQVGINGREWLARQMQREKLAYRQHQNTFTFIEDFARAQALLDEQLQTDWPGLLQGIGRQLNPLHEEIFANYPTENYWTGYQMEWATDVVFRRGEYLKRLMRLLVEHAMLSFSCVDILRFFGKRVTSSGEIPERFNRELKANLKRYREGDRVKFILEGNSTKFYDKAYSESGNVLRAAETTTQKVSIFRSYRPKEGGAAEDLQWRTMRQGIADLHRRAEVSQNVNNRLMDALASVDDSRRLEELIAEVQQPTRWKQRRVRALQPFGQDRLLLEAINHGEFLIHGLRNRDLQAILYSTPAESPQQARGRSAAVSRKIRMLRAHGILHKVPHTHRYLVSSHARTMIVAILTTTQTSLQQINQLRGKAA
jgi:hypothetical protein